MSTPDTLPKRILITGASGFIGRHLLHALQGRPDAPHCIALTRSMAHVPAELHGAAHWYELDLAQADLPEALAVGLDAIVHLATPGERKASMPEAVRINVDASARLFEQAQRHAVGHLVHVSTASVYPPHDDAGALLDERARLIDAPAPAYPLTKRWAEELALAHRGRGRIGAVTILRPSSVYGHGQRSSAHIAQMADTVISGGQIYLAGSQGHRLTPLYIDDLVAVLLWALAHPADETYNVGGPEQLYEAELARALAEHLHTVLAFVDLPEQAALSVAISTAKLDDAFPDRPRTPLRRGLELTFPDA